MAFGLGAYLIALRRDAARAAAVPIGRPVPGGGGRLVPLVPAVATATGSPVTGGVDPRVTFARPVKGGALPPRQTGGRPGPAGLGGGLTLVRTAHGPLQANPAPAAAPPVSSGPYMGTSQQAIGGLVQAGAGGSSFAGLAVQHLGALVQAASGGQLFAGSMVQHLAGLVQAAAGAEAFTGATAQQLAGLRQAASGTTAYIGTATLRLGGLVQTATGSLIYVGSAGQRFGGLRQSATGTLLYISGAAGQHLLGFRQAATGTASGGAAGGMSSNWQGAPAAETETQRNPSRERDARRRKAILAASLAATTMAPRADAVAPPAPPPPRRRAAATLAPAALPAPPLAYGYGRQALGSLRQAGALAYLPRQYGGSCAGQLGGLGQTAAAEHVPHLGPAQQRLVGLGQAAAGTHALQGLVAALQAELLEAKLAHADALEALAIAQRQPEPLRLFVQDPVHPVPGGYQWGSHGKVYKSKAKAQAQARAIYAAGYREDELRKRAEHLKASPRAESRYVLDLQAIQSAIHTAVLHIVHRELGSSSEPIERHDAGFGAAKLKVKALMGHVAGWVRAKALAAYGRMAGEVHTRTTEGAKLVGIRVGEVPGLQRVIETARAENVQLITNATRTYLDQVSQALEDYEGMPAGEAVGAKRLAALRGGAEPETVTEALQLRGVVSASRAQLIARDQTLKLSAALTRTRQQAAGVTKYVWNTSQDERVRPGHRELHGKTFSYDDPPETNEAGDTNNPGDDFQCRCIGVPVLEELESAEEPEAAEA